MSFGVVENCKRVLTHNKSEPLNIFDHVFCGGCSGIACSVIDSPTELARIKLQTQKNINGSKEVYYKNSFIFIIDVLKKQGIGGVYKGYFPTLLRNIIGDGTFFATYQTAPKLIFGGNQNTENRDVKSIFVSGGLAGIIYWTAMYPIDTIKSKIQADLIGSPKYSGTLDCL